MKSINVNGIRLNVLDEGSGLPLVFVHGFPMSHAMWAAQTSALCDRFRVIAPDLRGFGDSPDESDVVTMEQLADDLAAMLEQLGISEPVVLCGLSMGGYVAWQFVRKYPDKLRGLVLCDTRAVADSADGVAHRLRLAQMVLEKGADVVASTMLPNVFATATPQTQPAVVESLRRVIMSSSPRAIAAALRGMAERPDVRSWLPQITLPTLLIVGVEDKISTVSEMREIAAALPYATLVEIANAGHLAPLENPTATNRALRDFLETLRP